MTREEAIRIIEEEIHIDVRCCTHEDACRFEDALRMAISALREQEEPKAVLVQQYIKVPEPPKWISVEERLPDDSFLEKEIIICALNRFGERKVYTKKFWGVNSALWNNDTTHWMPLPSAEGLE